jgi:hypothetical protein
LALLVELVEPLLLALLAQLELRRELQLQHHALKLQLPLLICVQY